MISSWKNFALLAGDGRETERVAKGDSSQASTSSRRSQRVSFRTRSMHSG